MRAPSISLLCRLGTLGAAIVLAGCGWRTGLLIGDGSVSPGRDLGRSDLGPVPDGGFPDFGPLPDFGPPPIDFGPPPVDFGPPDLGRCRSDTDCDDRLVCNGREACVGGSCVRGDPFPCGDTFICTNDVCTEPGLCAHVPDSSRCPPGQVCSPTRGCTTMACPPGGCDDGIFCDGVELCGSDGFCHPSPPPCGPPGPCGPFCDEASHTCSGMVMDADGDGFFGAMCGGDDCNDRNPAINPGAVEVCNNGVDDDCNFAADCMDPACFGSPVCGCVARPEVCDNGVDDDCNTFIDCADPSCRGTMTCTRCIDHELGSATGRHLEGSPNNNIGSPNRFNPIDCGARTSSGNEITYGWAAPFESDYIIDTIGSTYDTVLYVLQGCGLPNIPGACDDDGGGGLQSSTRVHIRAGQHVVIVVDAWSSSQVGTYSLAITPVSGMSEAGLCRDMIDNDFDGLTDCADPDCAGDGACCIPRGPEVCGNGIDDDCNMLTDCADPRCAPAPFCGGMRDGGPPPSDGGVCTAHENTIAMCTNGRDDNCDTRVDCADPDCSPFGPMGECCNGVDDNGDGLVDEFTCRCFSNADCSGVGSLSQTCWLTTFHVCAPRCDFYGGTAWCRMYLGAASTCNPMTGECEDAVIGG